MNHSRTINRAVAFIWAALLFIVLAVLVFKDYRLSFRSVEATVVEGNVIYGINSDGVDTQVFRVSVEDGTGSFIRVPMSDGNRIVTLFNPQYYDGRIHFDEALYAADGAVSERRVYWNEDKNKLVVEEGKSSELISMAQDHNQWVISEAEVPSASILEKGGKVYLYVWKNGHSFLIDSVRLPRKTVVIRFISAFVISALLYFVLLLISDLVAWYRLDPGLRIHLSILTFVLFLLLLPAINDYLRHYLYAFASRHALYHAAETASICAYSVDDEQLERFLTLEDDFRPELMDEVWRYEQNVSFESPEELSDSSHQTDEEAMEAWGMFEIASDEDVCIISRNRERVRILSDDRERIDPWLQSMTQMQRKHMVHAFETGNVQNFIATAGRQRYATVYYPYTLSSGRKIVIGSRIPLNTVLMSFFLMRSRVMRAWLILAGVMMVLMLAGISMALRPLESLKRAVRGITAGDLTARADARGVTEISHTALEFNALADQLQKQSAGTDSYRHFYDAFFQASLLRRLSGRSLSGALHPGASYKGKACILAVDLDGIQYDQMLRDRIHQTTLLSAREYGGHPGDFDEHCLRYVFTEEAEAALRFAVDFQQKLLQEDLPFVPAGITSGEAKLSLAGGESRMSVAGPDSIEAEAISSIAVTLKIPVIVSEALFLEVKRQFTKVHFRNLGRIAIGDYVPDAPLYELLDADPAAVKKAREYSLSGFEKGVQAYARGDYFTARNEMIRVLDLEPQDLAARCYVLNCERKEPPVVCQAKV